MLVVNECSTAVVVTCYIVLHEYHIHHVQKSNVKQTHYNLLTIRPLTHAPETGYRNGRHKFDARFRR